MRIAHNTLLLYFRLILIMLVSLYTVRVVLNELGAQDYGIYDVVGGVVVMFAFINNAMADGTQRFLNFALGQNDVKKTKETFSSSLIFHLVIAVIFVIAAETIGLWFVNCKLNIPEDRHYAAMMVYQFTILTAILNIIRVPYNAVIIAYEKISFFAWLSIVEALLKLLIVYLLSIVNADKLILYAAFISLISVLMLVIYKFYCNLKFEISHYSKISDTKLMKELVSFSGWSLFGATANVSNRQGTNIVLNMFTNVAVNAAMGIANQVNNAIYCFASNFQVAFKPQLIQLYAAGEKQKFVDLIFKTSKFSFFLLYFIILPLSLNVDYVLELWLKHPPESSVIFVKLILICSLIDAINGPLWISAQAIGNIRKYQIIVSTLIFLNLPFCIVAFICGASPEWIFKIRIILLLIITIWRVFYLKGTIAFPWKEYSFNVLLRCVAIVIVSQFLCYVLCHYDIQNEVAKFFYLCFISCIINFILIISVGVTKNERSTIIRTIKAKLSK